ncbi:MAG: hypothetical protein U9O94_09085 [Nanoarchaeota archaeon]|nr:hypothetical protein [Nanoarchaeota archaeon]
MTITLYEIARPYLERIKEWHYERYGYRIHTNQTVMFSYSTLSEISNAVIKDTEYAKSIRMATFAVHGINQKFKGIIARLSSESAEDLIHNRTWLNTIVVISRALSLPSTFKVSKIKYVMKDEHTHDRDKHTNKYLNFIENSIKDYELE